MGGCGIICEYNPFHKGHMYQLEKVKQMGFEYTVCAMSGSFVQRAEPAFQPKEIRAQNAVRCGADIVLELPFPFSSLGAEGFARAGIEILAKSSLCSHFAFGSECADLEKLNEIASVLDGDFYKQVISLQKNSPNLSFAAARQSLIGSLLSPRHAEICKNPNDILAIEYIRANNALGCPLVPVPIKRSTPRGGFDESFASSSYIRRTLSQADNKTLLSEYIPKDCDMSQASICDSTFYSALLINLLLKEKGDFDHIAEISTDAAHSVMKNAKAAGSYNELCTLLASKTFTDAKIRRMLLFSFLGVTKQMAKEVPLYTFILALNQKGRSALSDTAPADGFIMASRISDIKKSTEAFRQYSFSRKAEEVLFKCRKQNPSL